MQIQKYTVNVSILVPLKGDSSTAETLLKKNNHYSVSQMILRFEGTFHCSNRQNAVLRDSV
jgi:hypothetical protein